MTFRYAEGGVLADTFNRRWSDLVQGNPDVMERELFDSLLEEVESLADATVESATDSMPGMSSAYRNYFVSSARKAKTALKSFID